MMHHTGLHLTATKYSSIFTNFIFSPLHFFADSRQGKPRNRPSFRQILLHLDIASADVLGAPQETYFKSQVSIITQ